MDLFDMFTGLIGLVLFGFAMYGINCIQEKREGNYLSSYADSILEDIFDHDIFFPGSDFLPAFDTTGELKRWLKPHIVDSALDLALKDLKSKGKESYTAREILKCTQEYVKIKTS